MAEFSAGPDDEMDALIEEIHREFSRGLPERVATLREALAVLRDGFDGDAAERLFRTAHSLKGAAPAFGAEEVTGPAAALCEAGRIWLREGTVSDAGLDAARDDLERLGESVERFRARWEDQETT